MGISVTEIQCRTRQIAHEVILNVDSLGCQYAYASTPDKKLANSSETPLEQWLFELTSDTARIFPYKAALQKY